MWTVEYQCMHALGVRTYLGVNIYHREWNPPAADIAAIRAVVAAAGVDWDKDLTPMAGAHCNYTANPYP